MAEEITNPSEELISPIEETASPSDEITGGGSVATETKPSVSKVDMLWNALSKDDVYKSKVGSIDEFRTKMQNPEKVKMLWNALSKDEVYASRVGDEKTFLSKVSSPKPPAPSMKGGESGALVRPLTPTSASEGSESESWTQTVNPFADKGAVKPTQQAGATETPLTKKDKGVVVPKTYAPALQENIAKIEGMTMRTKFPEYENIQKGAFDFKQASAEALSKEEQVQKEQTLKRKEERRVQNLPNEIEALRKERADLLLDKSPEAKKKIAANEAVTKKMQQELNNLNNSKYESLQNLNQRAIKDIDLEVNEYLEGDPKLKDKIKAVGLTETETWDLAQKAIAKKIAPLEADLQMFKSEGTVDAASAKINLANALRSKQEKMTAIAGQMRSYETDYLNKTGFSGLNKELETTKKKLDSYEPYLKRANSEVKLHEKELTDLKTKLDSFSSLIKDNTFLGTAAQFEELKAIEKEYNNTIQDLNNVYKNESLLGYEDAVNNYNSLIAKKNNLVSGLKSTEYQKMANDLDALKLDYDMSYEDYSKYEEPKVKDRINQYFSTIQKIGEYDEKLKTTKGELSYIGELEKAQEKFNNTGVGGDFLDIGARAVNSILDASKKLVASPFRLAASFSDLAGKGSGTYHYSDWVADLIEGTGYEPLFLTKKTNNLYDAKSDKINLGFSPILGAVADQTGIILTLALTGKYSNPVVQRAMTTAGMDLTAMAEVSESAKIATTIAPAFMISYGDNYKEALSKGFSVEGAMAYSGGLSLLEGLTETMLPDQDLVFGKDVKNQLLNRFIKDYSKGKKYAIKNLAQNFLYNAGSEITEENIAALGKTIATSIGNLTSDDIEVEIPTINQTVTTAITSGLSGGGMGLFGSVSEQSQMYKLGVMNLANDFKTGKELLDKFKEKGKITDERYNKLISDAQKFQSVRGQIPNGLSGYKVMAIAEKMIAIKALSADMNDDKNNPINKINQKKINKIQDEVEAIIDDENFDKRAEYELNLEAENLDKQQQEKPATAEGEVVLTKNTSPTNEKYGTINRNDGKGVVDLTKEEYEAEQAKMQSKVDEQVTPTAEGEQVPKTKEEIDAEIERLKKEKEEELSGEDYRVVVSEEIFEGDDIDNEGDKIRLKIATNKDGSRTLFFGIKGNFFGEGQGESWKDVGKIGKDNTLTNSEYINAAWKGVGKNFNTEGSNSVNKYIPSVEEINAKYDSQIAELKKQNEKEPTKKEDGEPMPEGVSGVRTEGEERKTSAELRAEEEEVTPQAGSVGVGGEAKSDELVVKKIADKEIKRQLDEQGYETKNKTAKELRDLYKKEIGTDEYKEPPRNNYKLKVVSKKQVGGTDIRLGANSSDRSIRNNAEKYGEPIFDEKTNEYVWKTNTLTLWEMEDVETGKKYSVFGNKEYPFSDIEQGQPPNYGYIETPKFKNGDIFEVSANPEINEKYGNTTLKNVRKQVQPKAVKQSLKETPQAGSVGVGRKVENVRFEIGKKLNEKEKKEVLGTLQDAYKVNKRPYIIEESPNSGRERKVYLENMYDYMLQSGITGQKVRWYITLPDGRIAHPTEVYGNVSMSEVERFAKNIEYANEANELNYNEGLKNIKDPKKVAEILLSSINDGFIKIRTRRNDYGEIISADIVPIEDKPTYTLGIADYINNITDEKTISDKIPYGFDVERFIAEQSFKETPQAGSVGVGEDKIKLDPDLANIDPILIAARNGDVAAQKQFEEMGLDWKQTTTYRFVGQSEVDVLLSNKKVESKRGMADAGIDVTSSPKVTTAATGEYRVTFKESFDKNNGLGKVRKKNEEDSNLERGRGYDINDVAKIERIDEKGNVVETIYDQSKAGSIVEVESAYGNFLLNEIDKRHKEKYNGENIKSALAKQFNETLADRGENRAISNLEDVYMNYVPEGVKPQAYQALRKNFEKEQSLKETPTTEEKVSGGLTQEEKTNLENISKDAGVNFQEVRNVYNKYGDGKPLNEITLEDYQKAEEKRQELLTPKQEEDAKKQQSGQMREQGVQDQPQRKGNSDMPIINEAELQDGEAVEEEVTQEELNKQQDKETQVLLNGEAAKRRSAGKFIKDGVEYVRNKVDKGIRGIKGSVKFAEGVPNMPFTYKLVEAETLQPSHSQGVRNQMHFIPEAQPKRRNDEGSIAAEMGFANYPRFNELGEDTDAYGGAPVVNERNEVVQGNNRSAGLKLGYKKGVKKYKNDLIANAEKFGFTREQVEGMKNPILVREVAFNDEGAIEYGNYDVKDLETGGKRRIDPLALVKRIPLKEKARLAKLLFSGEGTLNSNIRANSKDVLAILNPFLNQAQRTTLLKDGEITSSGVEDIEALVQQFLFDNGDMALPELFENLPYRQREGIRKSLPFIFSAGVEADVIPEIQNAILALNQFQSTGIENFDTWLNQSDVFADNKTPRDIYTPQELAIARALNEAKTQSEIVDKFKSFSSAVQGTPETPANLIDEAKPAIEGQSKEEALKQIFNVKENESRQKENLRGGKKVDKQQEAPKQKPKEPTAEEEIDNLFDLYDTIDESKGLDKRKAADDFRNMQQSIKNPTLKRIFDNISDIHSQLEKQGLITKTKGCP